jgi:hypothetical protein
MTAEGKITPDSPPQTNTFPGKKKAFLTVFFFGLMLLSPWPAIKALAGMAFLLSLRIRALSRPRGMGLLAFVFCLAYIFSPYGLVATSSGDMLLVRFLGRTPALLLINAALFALALFWAWLAAGEVPASTHPQQKRAPLASLYPLLLALLLSAVNFFPLRGEVPIQGDEGWHIWRARILRDIISPAFRGSNLAITLGIILLGVVFWFAAKRLPLPIKAGVVCALGIAASFLPGFLNMPHRDFVLARYPFISVWLHQAGLMWDSTVFREGVYRLIPMLAVFAIGWFTMWALQKNGIQAAALGFGLAFVLTPNLYYHSTILYLELPALALLLVALYHLDTLLKEDFRSVRCSPGWYALLAAGFFKETMVFFIAGIIGLRLGHRMVSQAKAGRLNGKGVWEEIAAAFCIALPLFVYAVFRSLFIQVRGYSPSLGNLVDWGLYVTAGKALAVQFGAVLILALGGLIVGILNRRSRIVLPLLALFLIHVFFHFLDRKAYMGLARFNLFLFAPLAVLAFEFIAWLKRKKPLLLPVTVVLCLALNLSLSPLSLSGDKKPGWGVPAESNVREYTFPYGQMIDWLKSNRPNWPVLFACSFARHLTLEWYFEKAGYQPGSLIVAPSTQYMGPGFRHPRIFLPEYLAIRTPPKAATTAELHHTMQLARQSGYPLVLYHRREGTTDINPEERKIARYSAVKATANSYLSLVLYQTQSLPKRFFPYRAAVNWLKARQYDQPVLIGGTFGKTRLKWYFNQADYRPRRRAFSLQSLGSYQEELKAAIAQARSIGFPLVLFHRIGTGGEIPEGERLVDGYEAVKIFDNPFHKAGLVVYKSLTPLEKRSSPGRT